jgi:uncharacterized protein (TIGR03067 family)
MKRVSLALGLLVLLGAEPVKEKTDLNKLQGEWVMAGLEVDGAAVPEEKIRGTTLTIKDDAYIVTTKESKYEVKFKLDPSKKPKTIDMFFPDGTDLPKVAKGIYKLDGDTFVMVRAQAPERERPTEFGTWPNTGVFMVTWKRKGQ